MPAAASGCSWAGAVQSCEPWAPCWVSLGGSEDPEDPGDLETKAVGKGEEPPNGLQPGKDHARSIRPFPLQVPNSPETKMAIYISRKSKIENRGGQEGQTGSVISEPEGK